MATKIERGKNSGVAVERFYLTDESGDILQIMRPKKKGALAIIVTTGDDAVSIAQSDIPALINFLSGAML